MRAAVLQFLRSGRARRSGSASPSSTSTAPNVPEQSILVLGRSEAEFQPPGHSPERPDASELLRLFYLGRPALTVAAYRADLEVFAAFAGASGPAEAVARLLALPKHAADAIAHEWKAAIRGAPATRARRLATLRTLVKTARRFGVVDWELDFKMPRVEQYRDTAGPGLDVLRAMLRSAEELEGPRGLRARATLLLVGTLGLRRGEVAKLRVGDFDPQTRRLYVIGKSEKEGLLTVPEITVQALSNWIDQLAYHAPTDPLIQRLDKPGARVSGVAVYKIIAMLGELAGVHTWPHGLRHTAVTEVTRVDGLVAASQFARHSDVKTTMIYQDNLQNLAGKGAETMARLLMQSYNVGEKAAHEWASEMLRSRNAHEIAEDLRYRLLEKFGDAPPVRARSGRMVSPVNLCWYCAVDDVRFVTEHMIPRSRRGSDDIFNLAVACYSCNAIKSDHTVEEFRRLLAHRNSVRPEDVVFPGEAFGFMRAPSDPPPEPNDPKPFDPDNNAASGIGL